MIKSILRRVLCGVLAVLCAVVFLVPPRKAQALTTPIDEIETYSITVSINDDGSMNCNYLITWKVLDDKKEGPLTWVRIGMPTRYVSNVQATTDNIDKAAFKKSGQDTYIRIDFNEEYHAGEEVTFGFTCVVKNQYIFGENDVSYNFRPGWFSEIPVDNYIVRWNADKVQSVDSNGVLDGGYYTWTGNLAKGEKISVRVVYAGDAFNFKKPFFDRPIGKVLEIVVMVLALGVTVYFVVVILFLGRYTSDGYSGDGGSFFDGSSFGGGGDGGSCACACACACADGGRAGCSSKDFYGTKIESARVRARLKAQLKK